MNKNLFKKYTYDCIFVLISFELIVSLELFVYSRWFRNEAYFVSTIYFFFYYSGVKFFQVWQPLIVTILIIFDESK